MSNSLRPHRLKPTRFICPWNSPGKNTGVCSHSLLQGIFPTQELNSCPLHLLYCRQIFLPSEPPGDLVYGKLLVYGKFKFCSWIFLMHGQLNVEMYNPQIPTTDLLEYTEYPQTCQLKKPRKLKYSSSTLGAEKDGIFYLSFKWEK